MTISSDNEWNESTINSSRYIFVDLEIQDNYFITPVILSRNSNSWTSYSFSLELCFFEIMFDRNYRSIGIRNTFSQFKNYFITSSKLKANSRFFSCLFAIFRENMNLVAMSRSILSPKKLIGYDSLFFRCFFKFNSFECNKSLPS